MLVLFILDLVLTVALGYSVYQFVQFARGKDCRFAPQVSLFFIVGFYGMHWLVVLRLAAL